MTTEGQAFYSAARAVEKRGLAKHVYQIKPGGPMCLLGALKSAMGMHVLDPIPQTRQWDWMILAICKVIHMDDLSDIVKWNDAPERTKAEVVDVLDKCARLYHFSP